MCTHHDMLHADKLIFKDKKIFDSPNLISLLIFFFIVIKKFFYSHLFVFFLNL
jgi:hypothetical protein